MWKYHGNGICECVKVNYDQAARLLYLMPKSMQARATPHMSEKFLDPGFESKYFESREWDIKGGVNFIFRGCSFECDTKSWCLSSSRAS